MLHRLTEWEDNGYSDSDFWVSVFDDESNQIRAIMSGSTRFAGYAPGHGPDLGQPISDLAILQRALQALKNFIFTAIRAAEYSDVLEPSKVERGTKLRLLRNCKHKGLTIPVGTAGVVFWSAAYGKFYDKGYTGLDAITLALGLRSLMVPPLTLLCLHVASTGNQIQTQSCRIAHGSWLRIASFLRRLARNTPGTPRTSRWPSTRRLRPRKRSQPDSSIITPEERGQMKFLKVRMLGRCANGAERDSGVLVHLLAPGEYKALCGKVHGRRSAGWTEVEDVIPKWAKMCPRCEKQQTTRSSLPE